MIENDLELDITRKQAAKFWETIKELERQQEVTRIQILACRSVAEELEVEIKDYDIRSRNRS